MVGLAVSSRVERHCNLLGTDWYSLHGSRTTMNHVHNIILSCVAYIDPLVFSVVAVHGHGTRDLMVLQGIHNVGRGGRSRINRHLYNVGRVKSRGVQMRGVQMEGCSNEG